MATLLLDDEQVLALVRQLPQERRTWLFQQLLQDEWPIWHELAQYGTDRVAAVAALRGFDWTTMTEAEREEFIDTLLHEPD